MNDSIDNLESRPRQACPQLRLFRDVDQRTIAERAGISIRALGKLENGARLERWKRLRTLKALDYVQGIEMLAPAVTVNPIAMLGTPRPPQRVRRPRKLRKARRVVKPASVIEVRAWDQRVGAVARDPRLGYYAFAYAPEWRRTGIELAPLTLPRDAQQEVFIFPNLPEATFYRLPGAAG